MVHSSLCYSVRSPTLAVCYIRSNYTQTAQGPPSITFKETEAAEWRLRLYWITAVCSTDFSSDAMEIVFCGAYILASFPVSTPSFFSHALKSWEERLGTRVGMVQVLVVLLRFREVLKTCSDVVYLITHYSFTEIEAPFLQLLLLCSFPYISSGLHLGEEGEGQEGAFTPFGNFVPPLGNFNPSKLNTDYYTYAPPPPPPNVFQYAYAPPP